MTEIKQKCENILCSPFILFFIKALGYLVFPFLTYWGQDIWDKVSVTKYVMLYKIILFFTKYLILLWTNNIGGLVMVPPYSSNTSNSILFV